MFKGLDPEAYTLRILTGEITNGQPPVVFKMLW